VQTEGLFRISAPSLDIESYRDSIDNGNEVDFHGKKKRTKMNEKTIKNKQIKTNNQSNQPNTQTHKQTTLTETYHEWIINKQTLLKHKQTYIGVNPHLICGLIKLYFREQPEPLISTSLYNDFHAAGGRKNKKQT